jgi:8-oxo-dGTP pyrophosphatase MutT (NUDIX family)
MTRAQKSGRRQRGKKRAQSQIQRRRELSAGGVVWRRARNGALEVALIRPRHSKAWALPKGHLEEGETAREAAIREVREETGLEVASADPLGQIAYVFSWRDRKDGPLTRIFKRVEYFLMECAGGDVADHDHEVDEVAWRPLNRALARATYENEREILSKARARLSPRERAPRSGASAAPPRSRA